MSFYHILDQNRQPEAPPRPGKEAKIHENRGITGFLWSDFVRKFHFPRRLKQEISWKSGFSRFFDIFWTKMSIFENFWNAEKTRNKISLKKWKNELFSHFLQF